MSKSNPFLVTYGPERWPVEQMFDFFFLLLTPSLQKLPGHTGPHTGHLRHLKRKRVAWFECVRLCEGRGADAILI